MGERGKRGLDKCGWMGGVERKGSGVVIEWFREKMRGRERGREGGKDDVVVSGERKRRGVIEMI